jgi:NAD(P)H dehydrogenase (quinone)
VPTLVVTAHPDPDSLTHEVARRLHAALGPQEATLAHLAQEGFDPRFTGSDRADYANGTRSNADVTAEQRRIDEATHLVLVFPVYWWSMPALLKGWFDRVFIAGWAFDVDENDRIVPALERLTVHLVPVAGATERAYDKHEYARSFSTQIEHGIIDYCGARRGVVEFIHDSESVDEQRMAREVDPAIARVVAAARRDSSQTVSVGAEL